MYRDDHQRYAHQSAQIVEVNKRAEETSRLAQYLQLENERLREEVSELRKLIQSQKKDG
jgi:regulator of replication initiation timing